MAGVPFSPPLRDTTIAIKLWQLSTPEESSFAPSEQVRFEGRTFQVHGAVTDSPATEQTVARKSLSTTDNTALPLATPRPANRTIQLKRKGFTVFG